RRHLDGAAERGRDHRDGHPALDIGALALEEPVLGHRDEDVKIARRRSAHPALALAGKADPGAVLDPRRDVDGERLLLAQPSLPRAGPARALDDPAGALTGRAG